MVVRIAIVGAGISGLGAAWLLSRGGHEVAVLESESRLGGHSNTLEVDAPEGRLAIDTGFIVYNEPCYPNLVALFRHLDVPTAPTSMSFAVSFGAGRYEYSGTGLAGFLAQPANLLSAAHWSLAGGMVRFFREAGRIDAGDVAPHVTLGAWLAAHGYRKSFIERFIVPMGAAIWSTPAGQMLDFPFASFVRFFQNHQLLTVGGQLPWRTVEGGSRVYVERLRRTLSGEVSLADPVVRVEGGARGVEVTLRSGRRGRYDACLLACHADTALSLLAAPTADERALLGAFRYAPNRAVLHTDASLMPRRRRAWASWNYLDLEDDGRLAVTYWMNSLQPLATRRSYFVTLNPPREPSGVVASIDYHHPVYDARALAAQEQLWRLQGRGGVYLAGSYFGYGFHEDGLEAGLAVAEALGGVARPWPFDKHASRLPAVRSGADPMPLPVAAE